MLLRRITRRPARRPRSNSCPQRESIRVPRFLVLFCLAKFVVTPTPPPANSTAKTLDTDVDPAKAPHANDQHQVKDFAQEPLDHDAALRMAADAKVQLSVDELKVLLKDLVKQEFKDLAQEMKDEVTKFIDGKFTKFTENITTTVNGIKKEIQDLRQTIEANHAYTTGSNATPSLWQRPFA
jgi:hypothetical protein